MKAPRLSDGGPSLARKCGPCFRPQGQGAVARGKSPQNSTRPGDTASAVGGGTGPAVEGSNQAREAVARASIVVGGSGDGKLRGGGKSAAGGEGDPTAPAVRAGIQGPRRGGDAKRLEAGRRQPRGGRARKGSLRTVGPRGARGRWRKGPETGVVGANQAEEGRVGFTGCGNHGNQPRLAHRDRRGGRKQRDRSGGKRRARKPCARGARVVGGKGPTRDGV